MPPDQGRSSPASKVIPPSLWFPILVEDTIALNLLHCGNAYALFDVGQRNRYYLRQGLPWVDAVQRPM